VLEIAGVPLRLVVPRRQPLGDGDRPGASKLGAHSAQTPLHEQPLHGKRIRLAVLVVGNVPKFHPQRLPWLPDSAVVFGHPSELGWDIGKTQKMLRR
jgi:hypothetical protein